MTKIIQRLRYVVRVAPNCKNKANREGGGWWVVGMWVIIHDTRDWLLSVKDAFDHTCWAKSVPVIYLHFLSVILVILPINREIQMQKQY